MLGLFCCIGDDDSSDSYLYRPVKSNVYKSLKPKIKDHPIRRIEDVVDSDLFLEIVSQVTIRWNIANKSHPEKILDEQELLHSLAQNNMNGKIFSKMKKNEFKELFPPSMKSGPIQKFSLCIKNFDLSRYDTYIEMDSDEEAYSKLDPDYDYYTEGYPMEDVDISDDELEAETFSVFMD